MTGVEYFRIIGFGGADAAHDRESLYLAGLKSGEPVKHRPVRQSPAAGTGPDRRPRPHRVGLELAEVHDVGPGPAAGVEQGPGNAVGDRAADAGREDILVGIERPRSTSYRTPLTWKIRPRLPPKTDSRPDTPKKASGCWAAAAGICSMWTAMPKIGTPPYVGVKRDISNR